VIEKVYDGFPSGQMGLRGIYRLVGPLMKKKGLTYYVQIPKAPALIAKLFSPFGYTRIP
jgi:hypothetical protein